MCTDSEDPMYDTTWGVNDFFFSLYGVDLTITENPRYLRTELRTHNNKLV